ncbi:MAG: SUMF1/EgtB/PvdO family nonheme iron enzyme [Planctomycetes bacterium]|nr:SUMF1/EgtB/PvdO family nonheme iron enzyme [Planctomycetota bacterium]
MNKQNDNDQNALEYAKYLEDYITSPDPQSAKEAFYDAQLNTLTTSITRVIGNNRKGTILDIGTGKGIVLKRVAGITEFKDKAEWVYSGVGTKEDRKDTRALAQELEDEGVFDFENRFKFGLFDEFYSDWVSNVTSPLLVIIRNVFHELDICDTAKLMYTLASNLTDNDTLFIQDFELFPKLERDNACWIPDMFKTLLGSCGFSVKVTPCESGSGNKYFNVEAERDISRYLSYEEIIENVIKRRQEQLDYMDSVNDDLKKIKGNRDEKIAVMDFDGQYKALAFQLKKIKTIQIEPTEHSIPHQYKTWLKTRCLEMDIEQLVGNATKKGLFTIDMPEIFIPLYADAHANKEKEKAINIEKLVEQKESLVVAGQPGSGKTTLIKHLAYTILEQKNEYGFKDCLPLLILLSGLQIAVKKLEQIDSGQTIPGVPFAEEILIKYFEETGNGLNIETVRAYAEKEKLILLIDGLDEIEEAIRAPIISSLVDYRNKYNIKIVLAGRPSGIDYKVREKFANESQVTINNLNELQINEFLSKWFDHIPAMKEKGLTVKDIEEEIRSHDHIRELIETPLMLTAICVLYYNGGRVPDQRAELYEKFINNLLFNRFEREEAKTVRKFLMALACKVHSQTNHKERKRYFNKRTGTDELKVIYPGDGAEELEERFNIIVQRCGLLKEEDRKYLFWHLSFQEFLTARYFNTLSAIKEESVADYWQNSWYKEVVRLFIGYLYCNNDGVSANAVVESGLNLSGKSPYDAWLLASQSLLDIPPGDRDTKVLELVWEKLNHIINNESDHKIRVEAAETMGWLGEYKEDLQAFESIEGGEYCLKSLGKKVNIEPFEISRYPVTNSRYDEFIKDGGYSTEKYWSEEGVRWLENTKTKQPEYWNYRKWKCPNSPVVGVSWYEAEAFAKWLTATRDDGNTYRLPKEKEWEAAAGGKDGRVYPWGSEWDKNRCNNVEIDINKTSPVGIFESGNTPDGISDLSGNVREWCMDWYSESRSNRVLRGGSWDGYGQYCRSAYRYSYWPDYRYYDIGFRLVFVP